jgi:DNA-binding protein Fis
MTTRTAQAPSVTSDPTAITDPTDAYDLLTVEVERVEALLGLVLEKIAATASRSGDLYGVEVVLETMQEKLEVVRQHGRALLSCVQTKARS